MSRMQGTIGFVEDIRPLFSEAEHACMLQFIDLWDWTKVRDASARVRARIESGTMPPGGWPSDKRQLFSAWVDEGCPQFRGNKYADYFRELDAWTEYWQLYMPQTNGRFFFGNGPTHPGLLSEIWNGAIPKWKEFASFHRTSDAQEFKDVLLEELRKPSVKEAVIAIDELLAQLVVKHFAKTDGVVDFGAYSDCLERFAKDELPLDQDRFERVLEGDARKDHALHHTMDGESMWFSWLATIDCAALILEQADPRRELRAQMLAVTSAGSAFDFLFRNRGKTRPEYTPTEATTQLLRSRSRRWASDYDRAVNEARDLWGVFST